MSVFFVNATPTNDNADEPKHDVLEEQSPVQSEAQVALAGFWPKVMEEIKSIGNLDLKQQVLPLARIKKIMKLDEDVKMISAEAPLLFAKAAEIFVHELTLRAWVHTEDNKRRTLQRNDIAMAITKFDQFDFLIDIVPRDDIKPAKAREEPAARTSMNPDQVQYYFQLAQQHQQALQQNTTTQQTNTSAAQVTQAPTIQIVQQQPQQVQTVQVSQIDQNSAGTSAGQATQQQQQQPVIIQQNQAAAQQGGIQIVQQIVTPTGEIQQIPIQLTQQQLQMIRMQLQNSNTQPLILQAAPIQTSNQPQLIQVTQQSSNGQQVYLTQANGTTETD